MYCHASRTFVDGIVFASRTFRFHPQSSQRVFQLEFSDASRIHTPPDTNRDPTDSVAHPFGLVPHQIRGFLTHFSNLLVTGHAFDKCTACSSRVSLLNCLLTRQIIQAYQKEGHSFLLKAINDSKFLEQAAGLQEIFEGVEDVDVEWDEDI